jgi:hypothetical protein
MHSYAVGSLYHPDRPRWPEGSQFLCRSGSPELLLFFDTPAAAELADVARGRAEFALLDETHAVMFLLWRFGTLPWSDSPFSWWRLFEAERVLPVELPTPESRYLLPVLLVDAATGIVRAIRTISLSPDFSRQLRAALENQLLHPEAAGDYDAAIEKAYRRYPQTQLMVARAIARCEGGAV